MISSAIAKKRTPLARGIATASSKDDPSIKNRFIAMKEPRPPPWGRGGGGLGRAASARRNWWAFRLSRWLSSPQREFIARFKMALLITVISRKYANAFIGNSRKMASRWMERLARAHVCMRFIRTGAWVYAEKGRTHFAGFVIHLFSVLFVFVPLFLTNFFIFKVFVSTFYFVSFLKLTNGATFFFFFFLILQKK